MNLRPQIFRPRIFRTLLNSSPLVRTAGGEVFDYYVDSLNGSDSNDGLTKATAFKTITQALAATIDNRGASIGLKRGQRHVPPTSKTFGITGRWGGYGSGHMPFVDCSVLVDSGAITPHSTHANVYVVEITHAVAPSYTGSTTASILLAQGPHVGLWWETLATGLIGQYLTPIYGLADTATSEQFVKDNPGRVFVQKVGSTETDVRKEITGSTLRYTFQLADSSDPRTGGSLRYACYHLTATSWSPGAYIKGLAFGRNLLKDLCGVASNGSLPGVDLPYFDQCVYLDPGCHALVGPSHWRRCLAYSRTPGSNGAGGGWHNYTSVFESRVPTIEDCLIDGFLNSIYSHGASQSPVLQSMRGSRLILRNATKAFDIPIVAEAAQFDDVVMEGVRTIMDGEANVSRFTANMNGVSNSCSIFGRAPCGDIIDGVIDYDASAMSVTNRVISGANNTSQAISESLGTPTIHRVTFAKSPLRGALQSSFQQFIDFDIEDSVVGRTLATTNTASPNFLAASRLANSYIGPTTNNTTGPSTFGSLAAYQSVVPGADNDVVLYSGAAPVTFAGDPLEDPTITGPAEILGKGMGVDPSIILALPGLLSNVPTLQSTGFAP